MPDGLYERDALLWSEEQARLLQQVAAGEAGAAALVDWPNVIEELESFGRGQLWACRDKLVQAMALLLKQHAWPGDRMAGFWDEDAWVALLEAHQAFTPAMRDRIDVQEEYGRAVHLVRRAIHRAGDDAAPPRPWPDACPWTLDELVAKHASLRTLAARLAA